MDASAILSRLQVLRQIIITLEPAADGKPAKTVTVRRPPMGEWEQFVDISQGQRVLVAPWHLSASKVIAWSGFTEGGILGSEQAPDDAIAAFDPSLWMFIAADNLDWCKKIGDVLIDSIVAENTKRKADAGN